MTKRLNRVGLTIIAFIGLLCMIFLTGMVWRYTVRRFTYGELLIEKDSLGANLLCFILAVFLAYGIYKIFGILKQKTIHIMGILLALVLIGGMFFLIEEASATAIVADQAQIIYGAEWLLDGRYEDIYNYPYFRVYSYQLQVSKFFGEIIHLFGDRKSVV